MGIKAVDFERSALGTVASTVSGTYHGRNSAAGAMSAIAAGTGHLIEANKAVEEMFGAARDAAWEISKTCTKAYRMKNDTIASIANSKKAYDEASKTYRVAEASGKYSQKELDGFRNEMLGLRNEYNANLAKLKCEQFWTGQWTSSWSGDGKLRTDGSVTGAKGYQGSARHGDD